ncbi:EF-hand domain-containing protein [Roseitranquillus sediminis]|uniref:EF-hand domain-containing protein n=1 Tax=Roseitranquillus sediminis TaxID=2809051 RepID=UPI001D0CBABC|nr:hypothetical protein [Roseitranquillus sediminis]
MAVSASAQSVSFADIDANGDGALDSIELEASFGDVAGDVAAKLDGNGDGLVTRDEASAGQQEEDDPQTFGEIDLDGDGVLEAPEFEHAFGPEAQVALAKFDANGDGVVTLDEVRSSDDPKGERGHGKSRRAERQENKAAERETAGRGNGNGRSEDRGNGGGRGDDRGGNGNGNGGGRGNGRG